MRRARFEWDEAKDRENIAKHGISFEFAQHAFLDPFRVIAEDIDHSGVESRYYPDLWGWILEKRKTVV
jgi:hypothetical protein